MLISGNISMNMQYRLETIEEKTLIGMHLKMSLAQNKTRELWQGFMPRRNEIQHKVRSDLYSMQLLPPSYFKHFDPSAEFIKWAAVEVAKVDAVPDGMETFTLPRGLYAVFLHKGPASAGALSFQYIFGTWLPASGYELEDRPHYELLGEKYKHEDPSSEEEIWIPIKLKE
jgi:AraC family transcriptional regulator